MSVQLGTPTRRAGCAALALTAVAVGAITLPGTSASAADQLAVFSASATATPYGVVSRVPAETAGGYLFSKTGIDLGKARALAAGFTLGELGDLFVVSSAPPGTITTMPSVITAQDPPQEGTPNEATFSGGRSGSAGTGESRNFDLVARADETPKASASAAGQAVTSPFYSQGYSTSSSDSLVAEDGTVIAKAITSVQDILIGPAGMQLSIASATSLASVTIAPGKKPVAELQTRMYGAQLAGVPVTFDENGLTIDKQVAVPASAMAGFTAALASLAEQGLTFAPSQRQKDTTADGASVSGAVFVFRYQVPESFPRPSDIGSDQTFTVASVNAAAFARTRAALGPPPSAGGGAADVAEVGAPGAADTGAQALPTDPVLTGGVPLDPATGSDIPTVSLVPVPGDQAVAGDLEFVLPARVADPLPQQVRDSYQFVLLAALIALGGVFLLLRKRPI
ncbi:MAG: hypothetical protein ACT4PP_04475 [Sporichthyaceae bacterium]